MHNGLLLAASHKTNTNTSYQTTVLEDSPYAYYPLTETSGTTAYDISGNNRNGTYGTGITLAQNALLGSTTKYPYLPGTVSGCINIPEAANFITTTWTVECWVNVKQYNNNEAAPSGYYGSSIISNNNANVSHLNLAFAENSPSNSNCFWYHPGSSEDKYTNSNTLPALNTSNHLVVTFDSGALVYYLNGSLLQTITGANNATIQSALTIGGQGYVGPPLDGYIGEFAVYSTVLSSARVLAHYEAI